MGALFYRDGREFAGTFGLDDKSRPFTTHVPKCSRCGGAGGSDKWKHTGWTCYECGGTGLGTEKVDKLYTSEQIAKLNAAQAKRETKRAADRAARAAQLEAERAGRRTQFLADNAEIFKLAESLNDSFITTMLAQCVERARISPAQVELIQNKVAENARRAAAQHVGRIGERLEFRCNLVRITTSESRFGRCCFHVMRDLAGNTVVYSGSKLLGGVRWEGEYSDRYPVVVPDEVLHFVATVSEHSEYKGERQTVVSRPAEPKKTIEAA